MENIGGLIKRKADKGANTRLHSEAHVLADELSSYFQERKKFAMYLGIIKRLGVPKVRAVFAGLKSDAANVKNPRKLFMWLTSRKKDA